MGRGSRRDAPVLIRYTPIWDDYIPVLMSSMFETDEEENQKFFLTAKFETLGRRDIFIFAFTRNQDPLSTMAEEVATIFRDSGESMKTDGFQYGGEIGQVALFSGVALITLSYGRRWWLLFEGLLSLAIAGMTVASPKFAFETAMGSLIGEYDDCHNIVIRGYGILFLVRSGRLLFCQNSTDKRGVSVILEGLSMEVQRGLSALFIK
ncbi:hypothetical protein HOLleu_02554 [Holothuria leucospilota]|uniref:Uncharacterized protein n=1 Tax=Holothuria leucospilota TaxID=206669 RepID=A0A9Q1CRX9_HOLLE|nr:hypothetical protein HOLleu_02554 [Holothuria leucospilota]